MLCNPFRACDNLQSHELSANPNAGKLDDSIIGGDDEEVERP
jgi:hypothetical protein